MAGRAWTAERAARKNGSASGVVVVEGAHAGQPMSMHRTAPRGAFQ